MVADFIRELTSSTGWNSKKLHLKDTRTTGVMTYIKMYYISFYASNL